MVNGKLPALLIATIFAGTASAQSQLPPPDVPAVKAFVQAIDHNFYESTDPLPFYDGTLKLAERYYLTGAPIPNLSTPLGRLLDSDVEQLSFFNLYWVSDPTHSLSDPAGIYFGGTAGIDTPWITAGDIIGQTNEYDYFVILEKGGSTLSGTGDLSLGRAPEIDPASAASGLTLLLGGLAVLRGRRRVPSIKPKSFRYS
jgi:hypothetical protein